MSLRAAIEALRGTKLEAQPPLRAADVEVMLAGYRDQAFTAPGWLFELKYDGFRMLAERQADRTTLILRNGRDSTPAFPEIARALADLPEGDFVVDGELVCMTAPPWIERRGSIEQARCHVRAVTRVDAGA